MSSASDAASKIRDRVGRGILPRDKPERIYAGYGRRLPCQGCDEPILPAQIEYEFDAGAGRTVRLHSGCEALWQAERERRRWLYEARPAMAGVTVDIVDDDPAITEALQLVLEAYGLRARIFGSAEAFLESRPGDRQTACLLVDVHLTGMSGFDLTDRLSALGLSIPTVFMTGLDDGPTCQRARNAGAVAYLRKPFGNEVLITALRWAGDVLYG